MSWEEAVRAALPGSPAIVSTAHLALAPEPHNVRLARRFVSERTQDLPADVRADLVLIASELFTNGVVHARTPLEIGIATTQDEVMIGVHDLDLGRSEVGGHERDGGRGLALVSDLSAERGLTRHSAGGKTAWARVASHQGSA